MMSFSSWWIVLTTGQPIGQSMWHVQRYPKIDGYPVGQHPLVQLLKGMFNMRPQKPRYTYTWDVTKYLDCLGKTKLLPLKLLLIKLAMLFALPVQNKLCPLQSWISDTAMWPQKFLSHLCFRESKALQINYLKPFLCLFRTMRDSVPLTLCALTLKLHETCVQSSCRPNQTHSLFVMSNHIHVIQSLRLLLADGYTWS